MGGIINGVMGLFGMGASSPAPPAAPPAAPTMSTAAQAAQTQEQEMAKRLALGRSSTYLTSGGAAGLSNLGSVSTSQLLGG